MRNNKGGKMNKKIILCGSTYQQFFKKLRSLKIPVFFVDLIRFPDGEIKPVVPKLPPIEEVIYILATYPPAENILEFFFTLDALERMDLKLKKIIALVPYFGYARQDRVDVEGAPLSLKWIASKIPTYLQLITVDFHNPSVSHYFKCQFTNILPVDLFASFLKSRVRILRHAQVIAPDKGAREKINSWLRRSIFRWHNFRKIEIHKRVRSIFMALRVNSG
ncbi:MAG: ribose-phosphate pyrophosphokinase-like domain-containing protein [Patescibacteria group bacterium]